MYHSKQIFLTILLATSLFSSCSKLILRASGNYITPKQESKNSILQFCNKKKVPYDALYMIKDEETYATLLKNKFTLPSIMIFDKNRNLIFNEGGETCHWKAMDAIRKDTIFIPIKNSNNAYDNFLQQTKAIQEKYRYEKYDYYLIAGWAKFTPKLTKALFNTVSDLYNSTKLKVCIILLNEDNLY